MGAGASGGGSGASVHGGSRLSPTGEGGPRPSVHSMPAMHSSEGGMGRIDLSPDEIKNHLIRLSLSLWKASPIVDVPEILKKLKEDVFELFKIRDALRPVLIAKGMHNFSPVEQLPDATISNCVAELRDLATGKIPRAKPLTEAETKAVEELKASLYPGAEFKTTGELGARVRADVESLRKAQAAAAGTNGPLPPSEAVAALVKRLREAEARNMALREENARLKARGGADEPMMDVIDVTEIPSTTSLGA